MTNPCTKQSLESFRQSLHRSIYRRSQGQTTSQVLADALNVDESQISRWCDPPEEVAHETGALADSRKDAKHIPGKHLPGCALAVRTGQMGSAWLDWLCCFAGGVFVRLPQVNATSPVLLADVMRQMSEVIDAQVTGFEDAKWTIDEALQLRASWNEMVKRGELMVRHAEQSSEATPPVRAFGVTR